ncbi:MAG: FecR domain-containing protein [Planctomycetes bacterium]|nr:FecR domain-containing protein [Planctomycetota bacterium]
MSKNVQELIIKALEGQLLPEENQTLSEAIAKDPLLREEYLQQCRLEGMLQASFGGLVAPEGNPSEDLPLKQARQLVAPEAHPVIRKNISPTIVYFMAAAALIACVLGLALYFPMKVSYTEESLVGPVARVIHSNNKNVSNGVFLWPGEFNNQRGNVHLMLDSGAEIIVTGPAKLSLDSAMRVSLKTGKVSVRVPPPASGFLLTTERMSINDQGTSFGVEVGEDADTLHVFEGSVFAAPNNLSDTERIVKAGGSVVASEDHFEFVDEKEYPSESFNRSFNVPSPAKSEYVHYSFEGNLEEKGSAIGDYRGSFIHRQKGDSLFQPWLNGIHGKALHLNGNFWVQTQYRGVSGAKPRTVSLWLRVLPGSKFGKPASLVAWGSDESSQKWQVMLDTSGAFRVSLGHGYVIGSTDLRDGRWHHVGAVYLGGENADVRTHVRLYVDGKLEMMRKVKRQEVNTGDSSSLVIGQNITHYNNPDFMFQGLIDEVYIFREALLPNQILMLKEYNSLELLTH